MSLKGMVWYMLMSKDLYGTEKGSSLLATVQVHSSCCAGLWPVPRAVILHLSIDTTFEFYMTGRCHRLWCQAAQVPP